MAALARTPLLTARPSAPGRTGRTPAPAPAPARLAPARAVAPPTTSTMGRPDADGAAPGSVPDAGRSLEPARLPGTPARAPFEEAKLIQMAKDLFATDTGVRGGPPAEALLADDFRFEFPVVSLPKDEYLKAVRSFSLRDAIPNLNAHPYGWQVDPYEPHRVWFFIRTAGTATGSLNFFGKKIAAKDPPAVVQGAPEICSYTFGPDGRCTAFTGGYVADRRVGNTGGLGAVFGILHALGAPVPRPGTLSFALASLVRKVTTLLGGLLASVTAGGKKKAATA